LAAKTLPQNLIQSLPGGRIKWERRNKAGLINYIRLGVKTN